MSKFILSFLVIALIFITPLSAKTQDEILTQCTSYAKSESKLLLMEDPEVNEITQSVAWLSGYSSYGEFSPIINVLIDFVYLDGIVSYTGYKVIMDWVEPDCNIIEIEKLPL